MDDRPPGGDRRRRQRLHEARTQTHDDVGRVEKAIGHCGDVGAADAQRERVILGKRAFAQRRRHYRQREQLGKATQFLRCLAPQYALADIEHRPARS